MQLMKGRDYPTDMSELCRELDAKGIPYELHPHPASTEGTKKLIGYNPVGDDQVLIDDTYSVIRGMASFGAYEIMRIKGDGWANDPERFESPQELVAALSNLTNKEN